MSFLDDVPFLPKPILLGVLGSRADITYDILHERILAPILSELGRFPDRMILPSETTSSELFHNWSEQLKLASMVYETDWAHLGKRARVVRDARICTESTHLIIFLGKRSDYYEKQAVTIARKGKIVFTVSNNFELEEICVNRK